MRSKCHRPFGFKRRLAAPALLLLYDATGGIASSERLGAANRRSERGQIQFFSCLLAMIDLNLRPSRDTLRTFGFVALGAFGLLGGLVLWKRTLIGIHLGNAAPMVAYVLWGVGAISALLSLIAPRLNRYLYAGLTLLTFPIGFILSHVLLGIVFYFVITPVGVVMRLLGRDPLQRKLDPEASTYWVDHAEPKSVEEYFRQY